MSYYYPQGVMTLRVLVEDFGTKSARLQTPVVFSVIAKRIRVSLNSYNEADTFEATIDYKQFPFDPRIIRSCGVSIHVEDRKKLFKTTNALNFIEPTENNTIFIGFVDTDRLSFSEEAREVMLEGRDYTALLLDREYLGKPVATSSPLDVVIRELLNELDETKVVNGEPNKGLEIQNLTGLTVFPTLAQLAPDLGEDSGVKNSRSKRSYWDMIQNLVEKAGLISYVSLDKLIITRPRNLYDRKKAKIFIYGVNLSDLEFERKLGRLQGFNVKVVCLNPEGKDLLEARIPEQASEEWAKDIGVIRKAVTIKKKAIVKNGQEQPEEEEPAPYITFRVSDVANFPALVNIGEKIFEELGRQQIEGSLTTKEMLLVDNENNFFDVTKFRIGTPIEIDIAQGDLEGLPPLQKIENIQARKQAIYQFLVGQGYPLKVADIFAESLARFDTPFYTKAVDFTLDQETGWQMKLDFINFIELPRELTQ